MSTHTLRREYHGEGMARCITPTCSCGWRGIGYEAYCDYQYTLVADQERAHLRPSPPSVNDASQEQA